MRRFIKIALGIAVLHTAFLIPLLLAVMVTAPVIYNFSKLRTAHTVVPIRIASMLVKTARIVYIPARPLAMVVRVDAHVMKMISGAELILAVGGRLHDVQTSVETITPIILTSHATDEEIRRADAAQIRLSQSATFISRDIARLYDLYPYENVKRVRDGARAFATISNSLRQLLGRGGEKTYTVFFFNNRELRPGGGFIGSLAFVTFADYSMKSIDVEDVYEIDGQITAHFPPHPAVKQYLEVPHQFVRDSNFSPDFAVNVRAAGALLRDAGRTRIGDGAAGITTSAIEDIIDIVGPIPLPDYNTTVTKDNFYIITQSTVESDFFPGSLQKRNFLSALTRALVLKFETADAKIIAHVLSDNLHEKQIVLRTGFPAVDTELGQLGWTGSLDKPSGDYLFPVEANVGVNKANYYVHRDMSYTVGIAEDDSLSHTYNIRWKNNSPAQDKLGGVYKNYFQYYVPGNVENIDVRINGKPVNDFEVTKSEDYIIIAAYLEIPRGETRTMDISYESPAGAGDSPYTLTVQKQIGAPNTDLQVDINHPSLKKPYRTTVQLSEDIVLEPE